MRVYLDESGQELKDKPVLVGGALCPDPDALEATIRSLYERLKADDRFEGTESYENFVKQAFHNGQIPVEHQITFIGELTRIPGFRIYIAFSRRARLPELTDTQRCAVLYASLLPDLVLATRAAELEMWFEENTSLNKHFEKLARDAVLRAREIRGPRGFVPKVTARYVSKSEALSLGVIDFALAVVATWVAAGYPRERTRVEARNFIAIERDVAMIYDFDLGKRSTRLHREFA